MAGVPARLYHYGAYMTPALIRQASGLHSYAAFAGVLAPMGVFFTGLGAYALFGSFWGEVAGPGRRCGAAAAAGRRATGDAEHVHVVSLADPDLAQRELRVGAAGDGLAVRPARVHAGQSVAARHGLGHRGRPRRLQAALLHRQRASALAGSRAVLSRRARGPQAGPVGGGGRRRLRRDPRASPSGCPAFPPFDSMDSSVGEIFTLIKQFAQRGALRDFLDASSRGGAFLAFEPDPRHTCMCCSRRSGSSRRCW